MTSNRLNGKVALVTGASRGIGRGIALRLAEDGARAVAITYHSDRASAESCAAAIQQAGAIPIPIQARLEEPDEITSLFSTLDKQLTERLGNAGLDIVVNNAGSGGWDTLETSVPDTFDKIIAIHLRAPFFVTQAAVKRLRDGGRIINMSSGWSKRPSAMAPVYSMAKAGTNALAQALAAPLGERRITINTVAPGWTITDGTAGPRSDPALVKQVEADTALNRFGEPADIAAVVAAFASDDGAWLTGQYIDASGGYQV
ncbi:SDR family NAD(P)-dependent oxidoreductase [Kribbella sp. VKM Ac-2566]|uniref:SDR family NAD(P)-dependent oxidoreductase n=1 Tax=Kribbella sp. VKM Ac-2566 TaxID=2512218 RepID=UPI0010640B00|nr:SDR family oxidoreductase [Kribbella sp. VKM Ac-2566]TDX08325.1 glucose 1-dehydrogenase [Kribbella sp. VKM Ac-2566]